IQWPGGDSHESARGQPLEWPGEFGWRSRPKYHPGSGGPEKAVVHVQVVETGLFDERSESRSLGREAERTQGEDSPGHREDENPLRGAIYACRCPTRIRDELFRTR